MKKAWSLIAVLWLCAPAMGAASRLDSIKTWLEHLKDGLTDSAVRSRYQSHRGLVAVAAVRGAKQDAVDVDHPQWETMSRAKREAASKERQEFASAVDLALRGKVDEAKAGLEAFEKAHPKSRFLPEILKTREKLDDIAAAQPKP